MSDKYKLGLKLIESLQSDLQLCQKDDVVYHLKAWEAQVLLKIAKPIIQEAAHEREA